MPEEAVVQGASLLIGGVALLVALRSLARRWRSANPANLPYPPGPKGLPVIGNLLDLPSENPYEEYLRLSKQYGEFGLLLFVGCSFNGWYARLAANCRGYDVFLCLGATHYGFIIRKEDQGPL